jgi:hypothetical protein
MTLSTRDQVRLTIGDTDEDDPLLSDEEVDSYLDARSVVYNGGTTYNVPAASADACGAIAAKYSREFNFAEDGQRFDRAQRVSHYLSLEQSLRRRQGGISVPLSLAGTETIS